MLQKIYHNVWYCRTAAVDHRKYNVWGNIISGQAAKYMVGGIQFYTIQTHTNTQKIVYGVGGRYCAKENKPRKDCRNI